MLGSLRSRLYVFVNWMGTLIWGRDITYISEISEAKLWKNLATKGVSREQARLAALKRAAMAAPAEVAIGAEGITTKPPDAKPSPIDKEAAREAK